jgi:hypothetical protein
MKQNGSEIRSAASIRPTFAYRFIDISLELRRAVIVGIVADMWAVANVAEQGVLPQGFIVMTDVVPRCVITVAARMLNNK